MANPVGHSGSWFATWDGENIPCVHFHWTKGTWPEYVDPGFDDRTEWSPFITALQEGSKAILTTSHPPDKSGMRRRKGYTGIWTISNIRVVELEGRRELRFTFDGAPIVRFSVKK